MPHALLPMVLLALIAPGCARPSGRTAEVQHPDAAGYYPLVCHFLFATDPYDRAQWVHDGSELREEMERYFRERPRAERLRIADVEKVGDAATVTALVGYADGTEAHVLVAVRKGAPAWLVDWKATRALWE